VTVSSPPALEVRGLRAGYGQTEVLSGVDLVMPAGRTLVLIGPNGHGKTTLMRAISGLIKPTAGEVRIGGQRADGRGPEDITRMGVVHIPQGDHVFPGLTVEENLLMGAFPRSSWAGRGTALERAYALFPQLAERRDHRGRTLSGGERRQLALARGLMREARLLIVDEPSLGLAPVVIDVVYSAIADVAREGTTLLLVEENFTHIADVADRVCLMEMGRIVRDGTFDELISDRTVAESYLGML
jgi:branched-chain amino acid transport system ATP-binding protein